MSRETRFDREKLIKEIEKLIEEAYKDAETGMKFVNSGVEECSMWQLSIGLGDVSDSFGRVLAIKQLCKKLGIRIPYEIERKMDSIVGMHWEAYRLRDEFDYRCRCVKRR